MTMNAEFVIEWTCPYCKAANTDDYENTTIPMCGDCQQDVRWDEVEVSDTTYERIRQYEQANGMKH